MMCDLRLAHANQVGFVHVSRWDEIKTLLDNAITLAEAPDVRAVLGR